ncbi:aromatic acid exporter family protein [Snodgrassella sp. CFCC 13594]|uniref:FUSC family protein n=1 Tax=Snodgrassella sp. CFCC 13594 TaxID=1775559 RepID=UPI0008296E50|nr:FUSC family protein [Snodgrassella sp. CFCC 13594]
MLIQAIRLDQLLVRARSAGTDALVSALAAAVAWLLAQYWFDQPKPLFAAITAIICLAPGLPSHGLQSISVVVGVAIGMVVGEVVLRLPIEPMLIKVSLATVVSMILAASLGFAAVVPIQAGVSAVLIIAFGPETAGFARLLDVLVGSAVGLLFSQIVFTPSPKRQLDQAATGLLSQLAGGLRSICAGMNEMQSPLLHRGVQRISGAHVQVEALDTAIVSARRAAQWSIRGRWEAQSVHEKIARFDRRGIRLYASTLLLAEAISDATRKSWDHEIAPMPAAMPQLISDVADVCENAMVLLYTSKQPDIAQIQQHLAALTPITAPAWQNCVALVEDTIAVIERFAGSDAH